MDVQGAASVAALVALGAGGVTVVGLTVLSAVTTVVVPRGIPVRLTRAVFLVSRRAFELRAELVERGFALILDRGGMRRAWLRGRENLHKRYLIHVCGYNLGLILRLLTGAGTPRGFRTRASVWFGAIPAAQGGCILLLFVVAEDQTAALAVSLQPDPSG